MNQIRMQYTRKIALLLLLCTFLSHVYSLTIEIQPSNSQCYYEDLETGDKLAISYEVIGPDRTIDFKVYNSRSELIYRTNDKNEGEFGVEANESGHYEYCFTNDDSYSVTRVMWYIHDIGKIEKLITDDKTPDEALAPLEEQLQALIQGVNSIKVQTAYMKIRERTHRNTAESTNGRVKWWSIIQSVLLVVVCIFQILYLKHFFEVRHKHGI
ncbi:p24 complex component [Basidiobolus ranarum]|uniref:P24 complex component n=1 Tax=Basidiobolus ranarum TaxID=34480 RepID=A0ABR2VVZ8_9FUNG